MAQSSLITVTKRQDRLFRTVQQLIAALDTATGHKHNQTDSAAILDKKTQTALTDTATVTAAHLLTKILDGTPTAAAIYTLPTAELLVAAMSGVAVGSSFLFVVNNKSAGANTITVAGGAGGTGDGTLTVAQNVIRVFLILITNVTAASEAYFVYGIG